MGIFTMKGSPAYEPPELPLASTSRERRMSSVTSQGRRRSSFLPAHSAGRHGSMTVYRQPSLPAITQDQARNASVDMRTSTQITFSGRRVSQAIIPAFARRATLAQAEKDRDPTHMRLGETNRGMPDELSQAFFNARLSIDEAEPEERQALQERIAELREAKGKHKEEEWSARLGWDVGPPKAGRKQSLHHLSHSKAQGKRPDKGRSRKKERHRLKRPQRDLDSQLDTYNAFAQNGQMPLTTSKSAASMGALGADLLNPSTNQSLTSLQDSFNSPAVSNTPGVLDRDFSKQALEVPKAVPVGDGFDALDVMADHIFRIGVQEKKWFRAPKMGSKRNGVPTGVTIRARPGLYRTFPVDYEPMQPFEDAVVRLNPECAIKIDSSVVRNIVRTYIDPFPQMTELVIDADTRIQIVDEIPHLARARKHQYAAFVRSEGVLVVWADMVETIIPAAEMLEDALMQFIWRGEEENKQANPAIVLAEEEKAEEEKDMEDGKELSMDPEDVATRELKRQWRERPQRLIAPITDALTIMTVFCLIGLGMRTLMAEYVLDGQATRFALLAFAPLLMCIATFACMVLLGSIFQIFGPVRQLQQNSRYYSGIAPKRTMGELHHVTVQMPVYKEDLDEVIKPTIESLKKAITTYERQGGSCSVLVCDDGLQLLPKAEADRRRAFYYDNNIAYVARPGHNVNGFIRKGRFKKAGNMNYAISLTLRVEEIMDELRPVALAKLREADENAFWGDTQENQVYDEALQKCLEEKEGEAWASGNIRIGHYILIIDSDTRVPEDCFADAVSEMVESPEVAIIQHASGVMQVAFHYFENGISHFTRSIQTAISYCCASGEVAPFVGHNAFLRWSALQECMFTDPDDGRSKIWSEDHVSEDFQIAVTLQMKGYTIRWASYANGEFEEGVSLTCDDEINRWQKYAWGCSELIFHPFRRWVTKGPITPLFRQFVYSDIPLHSKFTISGYIFSYYAIACAWGLTIMNYFVQGWGFPIDGYYLKSWHVTLVCIVLFIGLSNIAFITLRYRLKLPDAGHMSWEQIKWIPFFSIFFTGMSLPIGAALISHLVGYQMTWSSTVKTVEKSNFFLQLPLIWKRFWPQLVVFSVMMAAMIVFAVVPQIPPGWRINNLEVIFPMALLGGSHLLYPFALNPWFLSFSF